MPAPVIIKKLAFQKEARQKLLDGVKILADAVTITLGPKGRNVAIMRQWGLPIVVHDGVTVAREVASEDPLEQIGIRLVREAASKTNEEAGDGTTTATLLAYELVKRGMTLIDEGINPMVLRQQIYAVLPDLLAELEKISEPVKNSKDIAKVAFISSANKEIGELVAKAVEKVGKDGLVTVDEGGVETEVEFTEGMEFDKGYLSPYFITNPQRMECVIENPVVVLLNRKLSLNTEIVPLLEKMAQVSKDIVLIAEDVKGDALATIAANKMKGNINAVAVAVPGHGTNKSNYLDDIAVLTGATVDSSESPIDIQKDTKWLGRAERVVVSKSTTVIIGGKGDKKEIKERIDSLKKQIEDEDSKFEKEKLEERLARISTGIGVIRVGAKTEIEMREKIERVKDAVGAATAAREEGVVPGGGSVFLQLTKVLKSRSEGEKLLQEVLESPARKLMLNSGVTNDVINTFVQGILSANDTTLGYEVESGEIKGLVEEGIIDPAKVVRLALENALSVGCSILTTDCLIGIGTEKKNGKNK
jgi:chaperonin GroEL